MSYVKKAHRIERNRRLLLAVKKHIKSSIVLAGETWTPADIARALEVSTAAHDDADEARREYLKAAELARLASENARALTSALRAYLAVQYGDSSPMLAEFGFMPKKRPRFMIGAQPSITERTSAPDDVSNAKRDGNLN